MNEQYIQREEVIDAENRLLAAQLASDIETLNLLLSDELAAVAPGGQILTKKADLDAHKAKTMTINEAASVIDDIKLHGTTAITIVTMTAKGILMGTHLEGVFRYFRVWKRIDGNLKVIGASIMQLP